ncbi:MAG: hypothetical protein JWM44_2526 [Bacilli bacterium]|jgi:hypothetical protein|nr:hypothetical protein [Bacilli bacterium]
MNKLQNGEYVFPKNLYHGTSSGCLDGFRLKLMDRRFWRSDRDFGAGLYMTTGLQQAQNWSKKTARGKPSFEEQPCVLDLTFEPENLSFEPSYKTFMADSIGWAAFILAHRNNKDLNGDPCLKHADIIMGPLADGNTGQIVTDVVKWNKDIAWFYDQITRNRRGSRLDSLRLGYQIVFSNEKLASTLKLSGYYIFMEGEWQYYEETNTQTKQL